MASMRSTATTTPAWTWARMPGVTGSMSYRPNVDAAIWFADHVLDRVRAEVPDATFFIVGSQPHRRLDSLREREGVEITGWVPDVNAFLHAAAVYVVPLRMGSGTRLKLLQAMAAGLAVCPLDRCPGVERSGRRRAAPGGYSQRVRRGGRRSAQPSGQAPDAGRGWRAVRADASRLDGDRSEIVGSIRTDLQRIPERGDIT